MAEPKVERGCQEKQEGEAKGALVADGFHGLKVVARKHLFLDDELGRREDLGEQNHKSACQVPFRILRDPEITLRRLVVFEQRAGSDNSNAQHNDEKSDPLERVKLAPKEKEGEHAGAKNDGASEHLVNRSRGIKQAHVHQLGVIGVNIESW